MCLCVWVCDFAVQLEEVQLNAHSEQECGPRSFPPNKETNVGSKPEVALESVQQDGLHSFPRACQMANEIAWQWWIVWLVPQTTWQISIICGDAPETLAHHSSLVHLCATQCCDSGASGGASGQSIFMSARFVFFCPSTVILGLSGGRAALRGTFLPLSVRLGGSWGKQMCVCRYHQCSALLGWLIFCTFLEEVMLVFLWAFPKWLKTEHLTRTIEIDWR